MRFDFSPYSSVKPFLGDPPIWYPEEARDRVASYVKYDELYWNDETQFMIRILDGEEPIYIPNARIIVDTTSHYLLKGLQIAIEDPEKHSALNDALSAFLKREKFYSRFHIAKHSGVARGDFAMHMTADPSKPKGARISLNSVDPARIIPVYDEDDMDKLLRVHLVDIYIDPKDPTKKRVRKLTYEYVEVDGKKRVGREEAIYELEPKWWGEKPKLYQQILAPELLDPRITTIPIYWFKNIDWQGQEFGSSELRGFERLLQGVSQAATDQEVSLALEGLGVYATDGGRPLDEAGNETDWEVSPGKVMEVPSGAYFRRVEGLSTLKPSMDHIEYAEKKMFAAAGLTDVALGMIDVVTAQSGIALAIKFSPTLAKIEERDQAGIEGLTQLFFDWKFWMQVYEGVTLDGDIEPAIGAKLPTNRTETLNELNNMLDRKVISAQYYREKMQELGYEFPDDIADQIQSEAEDAAKAAALAAPPELQQNAVDAATGKKAPPPGPGGDPTKKSTPPNQSNNRNRPNESSGTEATQTPRRQARGGKP